MPRFNEKKSSDNFNKNEIPMRIKESKNSNSNNFNFNSKGKYCHMYKLFLFKNNFLFVAKFYKNNTIAHFYENYHISST